jgi:mono/diheme cytochrome c family protein
MSGKWLILGAAAAIVLVAAGWQFMQSSGSGAHVDVAVPHLSADAERGARVFAANCAACHGENAAGSDQGPPLVHKIYEPSHHGDQSFLAAVRNGVRRHHWQYGNMPPQPGVSDVSVR